MISSSELVYVNENEFPSRSLDLSDIYKKEEAKENQLFSSTKLPAAGEINKDYLKFIDQVVSDWHKRGENSLDAIRVSHILYRALDRTFQSTRLVRHLIHVLAAQEDYVNCDKAIDMYVHLVKKNKSTNSAEVARVVSAARAQSDSASSSSSSNSKGTHPSKGAVDVDSDAVVVATLAFAVKVKALKLEKPHDAFAIGHYALELAHPKVTSENNSISSVDVEIALGIAYDKAAEKATTSSDRTKYFESASRHFLQAQEESASSDPIFDLAFYYAYHLSLMDGATEKAQAAAKLAVEILPTSVKAWHLLVLLLSTTDLQKAYDISNAAISAVSSAPPSIGNSYYERLDDIIRFRLTRNSIIEALEGADSALRDQKILFSYYAAVFRNIEATSSQYFRSLPQNEANDIAHASRTFQLSSQPKTQPLNDSTSQNGKANVITRSSSMRSRTGSFRSITQSLTGGNKKVTPASEADPNAEHTASRALHSKETMVPPGIAPTQAILNGHGPESSMAHQSYSSLTDDHSSTPVSRSSQESGQPPALNLSRFNKLLVYLWVASAATFRRCQQLQQAKQSINEAVRLGPYMANVWSQYAMIHLASKHIRESQLALEKAISSDANYMPGLVLQAQYFLNYSTEAESPYAAEAILTPLSYGAGWNSSIVWVELARVYKKTNRLDRERQCLEYAVELQTYESIRPLTIIDGNF